MRFNVPSAPNVSPVLKSDPALSRASIPAEQIASSETSFPPRNDVVAGSVPAASGGGLYVKAPRHCEESLERSETTGGATFSINIVVYRRVQHSCVSNLHPRFGTSTLSLREEED